MMLLASGLPSSKWFSKYRCGQAGAVRDEEVLALAALPYEAWKAEMKARAASAALAGLEQPSTQLTVRGWHGQTLVQLETEPTTAVGAVGSPSRRVSTADPCRSVWPAHELTALSPLPEALLGRRR